MTKTQKQSFVASVREYFATSRLISGNTNDKCKYASVSVHAAFEASYNLMPTDTYLVRFELIVFTDCNGEDCRITCGHDNNSYNSEIYDVVVFSRYDADELIDYAKDNEDDWTTVN